MCVCVCVCAYVYTCVDMCVCTSCMCVCSVHVCMFAYISVQHVHVQCSGAYHVKPDGRANVTQTWPDHLSVLRQQSPYCRPASAMAHQTAATTCSPSNEDVMTPHQIIIYNSYLSMSLP